MSWRSLSLWGYTSEAEGVTDLRAFGPMTLWGVKICKFVESFFGWGHEALNSAIIKHLIF